MSAADERRLAWAYLSTVAQGASRSLSAAIGEHGVVEVAEAVRQGGAGGRLQFADQPAIDPMGVIRLIQGQPKHYRMDGPDKLRIILELPDFETRLKAARGLLVALAPTAAPAGRKQ